MQPPILKRTLEWFHKAVPQPTSKNLHAQLGCHFEEVNEMLMEVSTKDYETQILIDTAKMALHALATHLKASDGLVEIAPKDRAAYLDGLCDQIVTAVGCAHMSDLDILGAMVEVNRSNFSKFGDGETPIFDPNMKVMKGPDYFKPILSRFV